MAMADTLQGTIELEWAINLIRAQSVGGVTGKDELRITKEPELTDGTGTNQATGWFSTGIDVTTGATTISLADSADPTGALGDDVPTSDPEGLKLRAICLINTDDTNYVTVGLGANALTSWLAGTGPTVRIPAGGFLCATFPAGLDTMNDGADDEITLQADTATCRVELAYLFG